MNTINYYTTTVQQNDFAIMTLRSVSDRWECFYKSGTPDDGNISIEYQIY